MKTLIKTSIVAAVALALTALGTSTAQARPWFPFPGLPLLRPHVVVAPSVAIGAPVVAAPYAYPAYAYPPVAPVYYGAGPVVYSGVRVGWPGYRYGSWGYGYRHYGYRR